jgi:hypothetical protein
METSTVLADSILRNKKLRLISEFGLAILVSALAALLATRAAAYSGGTGPLSVGSVNDYVSQGQPRYEGYGKRSPYMGGATQGYYGAQPGYRSQRNASAEEAMVIALMLLQHYEERHQLREIRHHSRHSGWANNPMQSPLGVGYGY